MMDSAGGLFSGLPALLAKLPGPLGGLLGGGGGDAGADGGLLNVVGGPLNLLGGGGSGDDASNEGKKGGLLGLQLPGSGSVSDDGEGDSFIGVPNKLASRPTSSLPIQMTQPIVQTAQSAIWKCDPQGLMGAMWQNPGGGAYHPYPLIPQSTSQERDIKECEC